MRSFVHDLAGPRVVFGVGALAEVADEVARLGARRVLLIAGDHEREYADRLAADLADRLADRLQGVVEHVPEQVARAAAARAEQAGADFLLCVGGGSATGLAKAVATELSLPILAVPTTYAGSEMTPVWGLTKHSRKITGRDPRVLPRTVVYDPALTVSLPARVTATSGMNALAHCAEALYAPDTSPVVGLLACEGARALARALPICVAHPGDLDARAGALYGAWLAGLALGNARMGVHHRLAHVLGGTYRLPHGAVHAALLPYAVAYNREAAPEAMRRLAAALGADDAAAGLWDLAASIGAPTDLRSVGFPEQAVPEAAAIMTEAETVNPRAVTEDGVRALLHAAYAGHRPSPPMVPG